MDDGFAAPRFGHPKDRRPDLKQIQARLAVTGDGAIPILHKVYDGGAAEVSQVVTAMESLRTLAGPRQLLMVGDSKLVSYPNLAAMVNAGVDFIAPASKTYVPASTLARCELASATPVAYAASRDSGKKPEDRGNRYPLAWLARRNSCARSGISSAASSPVSSSQRLSCAISNRWVAADGGEYPRLISCPRNPGA